ncbi:MAG: tetratricopeptide repeat protein [Sedimentisphaerales bacterium]
MAKRRLNKKVALIGSMVFLLLMLVAIVTILHLSRDPDKFIQDGDTAALAKDYKTAERSYLKAHRLAKSGTLRKELLFKLADIYIETGQWPKVRGCWEQIINIDPKNIKARLGRLKYLYIIADSYARAGRQTSAVWKEVQSQASQLLELATDAGLTFADRAEWEPSFDEGRGTRGEGRIGPYLYLLRGRAAFELARMGAVTAPDELLAEAIDDLQKARELDPNNVDAYWYLAQAAIEKGEILASRGNLEERHKAAKQADELLQQAVKVADTEPAAHINLLTRKLTLARRSAPSQITQQIKSLEPEFLSLVNKFPSSAEAFATLSGFYSNLSVYSDSRMGLEYLDKAVGAAKKALELDKENVTYAIAAANLCYRKFSVYGQKPELAEAIAIAKNALELPDAQDTTGPRSYANRMNRFLLCSFLANCYIEQILLASAPVAEAAPATGAGAKALTNAEQLVHEIEQIFGSGEEPQVIKWQGMLQLAKGNMDAAVRKLYAAYEQIKASYPPQQRDAQLSYTLAQIFQDTPELGAVMEFLASALEAGIDMFKPEAILDYLEVLGKRDMWSHVLSSVNPFNIDAFEQKFGRSPRSQTLRIKALIGTNQVSEAEEELAKLDQNDPEAIKLHLVLAEAKIRQIRTAILQKQATEDTTIIFQPTEAEEKQDFVSDPAVKLMTAELENCRRLRTELLQKLLMIDPNAVEDASVIAVCRSAVARGQIDEAKDLSNRFLKYFPDNTMVLFYKQLLSEPDPKNISPQRRQEIKKQVLLNITDPLNRAVQLGIFYRSNNELDKATEKLKEALEMKPPPEGQADESATGGLKYLAPRSFDLAQDRSTRGFELRRLAVNHLFDIACQMQNWKLAEQMVELARRENLDDCQGQLFAARFDVAKGEFNDALAKINECLRQRPIFSYGFLLRSNINAVLGTELASIEDIRKATSLNPLDGAIAKRLAAVLYLRNQKLGDNVTSEQKIETRSALERAIRLNPGDLALLSDYAEYISDTEPSKALAIRQTLQKNAPNLHNAILLGRLATKMALKETDGQRQETLFEIAQFSLEQAKKMDPHDKVMLESYAEYYRARGQEEKAKQLLLESQDDKLLWRHYFQLGRFEDAQKVLQQLYKRQAKDIDVVKGLLLVAEKTDDKEAINRYSEELLSLQDNAENRLEQIRAFLGVGLIEQAKYKLQSFKEKYPDESRILLLESWLAMRQGQLQKALELANRNLQSNQDHAGAWRLRGQINLLMANYNQAINDLKKSKSLSDTPATRLALAKAYLQAEREDDAITELKNTIDMPGAPMEARELLEQIYLRLDRKEQLRRFYEDTLEKFPNSVPWYNRTATFAIATGEFDRAEELYKKAYLLKQQEHLGENPEKAMQDAQYAAAFDGYLQALILAAPDPDTTNRVWREQKLDTLFEEAKKHENTPFAPLAFCWMGEAKLKLGDRKTAIEYYRKAVDKAETNDKLAAEILLRMFSSLGAEEVSKYCQQRLRTNPDSLAANFTMSNLARINSQYDEAIDYIKKCVELTGPDTPRGLEYLLKKAELLTLAYEKTSDNRYRKEAITDYQSLLAKMPNNTNVLNNLAYMLAENNQRLSDALKYAKKAHKQKPNNPNFMDTYAYVLYKNGQSSQAVELLTAALQQYRHVAIVAPPEVWEHLGMVKEQLGEKAHALDAYKRALQVGADKLPESVRQRITSAIERLSR